MLLGKIITSPNSQDAPTYTYAATNGANACWQSRQHDRQFSDAERFSGWIPYRELRRASDAEPSLSRCCDGKVSEFLYCDSDAIARDQHIGGRFL